MNWLTRFPELSSVAAAEQDLLLNSSTVIAVPANTVVFGPGKKPDNLLLVLDGALRVQHLSDKGREIVLYRVRAGESCVLTTSCLLAHEEYPATGITETVVQAAAIPRQVFDTLLGKSAAFRQFVFSAYSRRITDLFLVIEDVAFQKMDIRVAQKLLELVDTVSVVSATHQQLAVELGTAREVVSRQLSEFQRRGWVSQTRGSITLLDCAALKLLTGQ
jgi:CRP/FNR family transcriptional regulator